MAIDLAKATGIAWGPAGKPPKSRAIMLRKTGDDLIVSFRNLALFMRDHFTFPDQIPDLIVVEAPMTGGIKGVQQVMSSWGLYAVIVCIGALWNIRVQAVSSGDVRKHLIGRTSAGNRDATKLAVVRQCQILGLIPKDCFDNNRADAAALHDYASFTFARIRPKELVMFGGANGL